MPFEARRSDNYASPCIIHRYIGIVLYCLSCVDKQNEFTLDVSRNLIDMFIVSFSICRIINYMLLRCLVPQTEK